MIYIFAKCTDMNVAEGTAIVWSYCSCLQWENCLYMPLQIDEVEQMLTIINYALNETWIAL